MNTKSIATNLACVLLVALSFVLDAKPLLMAGLFGLSGALTNQLAVHMLFEKVPFLYGSGVILLRFEAFKEAVKHLMMEQFFTQKQLDEFFLGEKQRLDLAPIVENTDFSPTFDALTKSVMESHFGTMLGMFGGEKALEGLREPFEKRLKESLKKLVASPAFGAQIQEALRHSSLSADTLGMIEGIIETRLGELTPQMVKEMVQTLIKEHLGWLVVWGGFFGGLIGLLSASVL
jgi:hypothetical protein